MASAANVAAAETLGDELLKGCEHTTRHNRVVAAWVRAVQAARGAAHTRATAEAPAWSAPSVPDFVSEYAGQAGAHQAGEVKVYNMHHRVGRSPAATRCDLGLWCDARAAARGEPRR